MLALAGPVKSTPEFGLLAAQVSTAQARSAGGQRHFRPPVARYHAPIAMRASASGQVGYCTTVASGSHVRVKTTSYTQVFPNLRVGQDSEKLGDVSKQPKTYCAASCKSIVQQVARVSLGHPSLRACCFVFETLPSSSSCSDRRHRRGAVRALSLQDRPGLQPIRPGTSLQVAAGWLGSDCLRRRARPASRAGRSSHGLGAPDVPM